MRSWWRHEQVRIAAALATALVASKSNLSIGEVAVFLFRGLLARRSRFGDFARAKVGSGVVVGEFLCEELASTAGLITDASLLEIVVFHGNVVSAGRAPSRAASRPGATRRASPSRTQCLVADACVVCVDFLHLRKCSDVSGGCLHGDLSAVQLDVVDRYTENSKFLLGRAPEECK